MWLGKEFCIKSDGTGEIANDAQQRMGFWVSIS